MGCTESIISAMVARSNENQKVSKNQGKVQPAPLRGDKGDRDEARERRRKALVGKHAKAQSMAQSISENAMAEKERLSSSTWRSWKSAGHSDVLSPAVSISVRGSDGTASPENLPNPASAYQETQQEHIITPSTRYANEQGINANDMQIRTMELPNQVADEPYSAARQNIQYSELMNIKESVDEVGVEVTKRKGEVDEGHYKGIRDEKQSGESVVEPGHQIHLKNQVKCEKKDTSSGDRMQKQNLNDCEGEGETAKEKEKKKKGKHKEVKFSIQELETGDSRQGR